MKTTKTEAFLYAIAKLSKSDITSISLIKKLQQKGFDEKEIMKVIACLKEKGYLDDRRYAVNFINKYLHTGKKGPILLYYDLRKKGIAKPLCKALIEELYTPEVELEAIKKMKAKDTMGKKKLAMKLKRKGFRLQTIRLFLNSMN